MKISDVLADKVRRVVTVRPEKHLSHIARLFDERNIASVVVTDHAERPSVSSLIATYCAAWRAGVSLPSSRK